MSTRRGFPEPLPPEKGHGGAFRTVPWERYPHPRGKTVRPHFMRAYYTKKASRNFFKSEASIKQRLLLSHCDAVPSA